MANSMPDTKTSRGSISKSGGDMEAIHLQTSPPRNRAPSRTASMMMSPAEQAQFVAHMSAHEPRMFPGVLHERTRRDSMRFSASAQDMGTLGPALARMAVRERAESGQVEEDSE
jgi:hypothetical protein